MKKIITVFMLFILAGLSHSALSMNFSNIITSQYTNGTTAKTLEDLRRDQETIQNQSAVKHYNHKKQMLNFERWKNYVHHRKGVVRQALATKPQELANYEQAIMWTKMLSLSNDINCRFNPTSCEFFQLKELQK